MRQKQKQIRAHVRQAVNSKSALGWTINIVGALVGALLVYTVITHELLFRFFVFLFLFGFAYMVNKKLNELKGHMAQASAPEISEPVLELVDEQPTRIFEIELTEKEHELEKIDLDRTQLLEELFTKAELEEAEKQAYREKIKQKDSERSTIMQDLLNVNSKLQHAVLETKKYFVKVDPMKEIAAAIEPQKILEGSIATLNEEVQAIIASLSEKTVEALKKNDYVDEDLKLTRSGYKALVKTVPKE